MIELHQLEAGVLVSDTWRIVVGSPESCREQDKPSSLPPSVSTIVVE